MGAAVVLALTALAVTIVVGLLRTAASPVDDLPLSPTVPTSNGVYVHVAGAITRPGLYRLPEGARVVDAVAAAGGFGRKADRAAVNLARPVSDGEQLHVPRRGETPAGVDPHGSAGESLPGQAGDGRVNLNTADAAALETLPRIGPALAGRIIEWREQNGRYASVEDLLAVPGIGEKLLAGLREKVTV
ncbi:MAG: ComEA family DNA-binding protein [Microbacterium sp.]|nr:MAG: ComEA family DNA-binding protein [Microbacterium sp.]